MPYRKRIEDLLQREQELSAWISSSNDFKEALQYILDSICSIDGIDLGGIYLLNNNTSSLELFVHHGLTESLTEKLFSVPKNSEYYSIIQAGNAIFNLPETYGSGPYQQIISTANILSIAILPLIKFKEVYGSIQIASRSLIEFEPELQHILISLSSQVSQFIEKNKADNKYKKMFQVVEQSPESIVITNIKGEIEYVNPKFCEITGYSFAESIGKNPNILKSGKMSKDEYKILWNQILSGKVWKGEFLNRKKNGDLYWESATISPIIGSDGKVLNFIGIKEDINNKKSLQEELIIAKKEAEDSRIFKSTLLNNLSYEVRSPLTSILGFTNFLRMEVHDNKQLDMLNSIFAAGEDLLNSVDLIITLSQLDSNIELKLENLDLRTIIGNIIPEAEKKLITKGVEFHYETNLGTCTVNADKKLLSLGFEKIIENSVKFTEKGFVRIKIIQEKKDGRNFFVACIEDSSTDVANTENDCLNTPFDIKSLRSANINETGSLGYHIACRVISMLGGCIEIQQLPGSGRFIKVFLPALDIKKLNSSTQRNNLLMEQMPDLQSLLNVLQHPPLTLLVEDNEMNAMLVHSMLGRICNITHANNGEKAINIASQEQFEIVLMDINLGPGLNGMEVTQELKKLKNYKNVPFAAVTGYALKEEKDKIFQSGLSFYLGKPFKKDELLDIIRKMLFQFLQDEKLLKNKI